MRPNKQNKLSLFKSHGKKSQWKQTGKYIYIYITDKWGLKLKNK